MTAALALAAACGPAVATDETTAADGSTGSPASTGSSSGHASETSDPTTEADTTDVDTTAAETTVAVSTGPDGTSTGEPCGAAGFDCCCFEGDPTGVAVLCSSMPLCDEVLGIECEGGVPGQFCPLGGAQVDNPTALDCVLEALVSSSVGHFDVIESLDGYMGREYTIYTTGTQEGFMLTNTFVDFSAVYDEAPRLMLETPEYFATCQQEPSAIDRYRCMRTGVAEVVEECLPL